MTMNIPRIITRVEPFPFALKQFTTKEENCLSVGTVSLGIATMHAERCQKPLKALELLNQNLKRTFHLMIKITRRILRMNLPIIPRIISLVSDADKTDYKEHCRNTNKSRSCPIEA